MSDIRECGVCGVAYVTRVMETQCIPYLDQSGRELIMQVNVPVYRCANCEIAYTDHEAEKIREDAMASITKITQSEKA